MLTTLLLAGRTEKVTLYNIMTTKYRINPQQFFPAIFTSSVLRVFAGQVNNLTTNREHGLLGSNVGIAGITAHYKHYNVKQDGVLSL